MSPEMRTGGSQLNTIVGTLFAIKIFQDVALPSSVVCPAYLRLPLPAESNAGERKPINNHGKAGEGCVGQADRSHLPWRCNLLRIGEVGVSGG
jgi:hypothetical protein